MSAVATGIAVWVRLLAVAVLSAAAPSLLAQADPHAGHGADNGAGISSDAPAGARDPNAYADGIGLTTGPYLLPGVAPPHTADQHDFAGLLLDRFE